MLQHRRRPGWSLEGHACKRCHPLGRR
jgi:hypothetical protein